MSTEPPPIPSLLPPLEPLEKTPLPFTPLIQGAPAWNTLTPREQQIALGLAVGLERTEIAKASGISGKTVDTHRQHIMHKLELKNNVELARYCLRHKIVSL